MVWDAKGGERMAWRRPLGNSPPGGQSMSRDRYNLLQLSCHLLPTPPVCRGTRVHPTNSIHSNPSPAEDARGCDTEWRKEGLNEQDMLNWLFFSATTCFSCFMPASWGIATAVTLQSMQQGSAASPPAAQPARGPAASRLPITPHFGRCRLV